MKILQLNKFFYPRGGAEHHMFDLIDLLTSKGHTVIPFSMHHPANKPSPYSSYFVSEADFSKSNWRAFKELKRVLYSREAEHKLRHLIHRERPDVAHAHLLYHHLSPSVLVALKKAGIPVVMTIHDWKLLCPNYKLFTEGAPCTRCRGHHYEQATLHRCVRDEVLPSMLASIESWFHHSKRYYEDYIDLLIAPSHFVKEMFEYFGWPKEKIKLLPHFLPPGLEVVETPIPTKPRFAYVGRLSAEKGIKELVHEWFNKKIPYTLEIYGAGPLEDELRLLLASQKGEPRVVLLGQMDRATLWRRLRSAAGVVIPTLMFETFGLVAIEAFASGIPVIASRRGALSELVERSGAGTLFDWSSSGITLLAALESAWRRRVDLRHRAHVYMSSEHKSDSYYNELMALYHQVLTNRSS
jgi:glycosyltransferase involved in cell wall biosynthesis